MSGSTQLHTPIVQSTFLRGNIIGLVFNMDVYDVDILPDMRSRLGSRIFPGLDFGNIDV